jgi:hypothetical protein
MIDPDLEETLDALAAAFGPVELAYRPGETPHGWRWADQWRDEPVGTCTRCPWPAHTPGPDGRPWHAFCWMVPTLPISPFERWLFRKVQADEWSNGKDPAPADTDATEAMVEALPDLVFEDVMDRGDHSTTWTCDACGHETTAFNNMTGLPHPKCGGRFR